MAGKSLQIDDDYCQKMSNYYLKEGKVIEKFINEYVLILCRIKMKAIMKGEVADALDDYIAYAKKLRNSICDISKNSNQQVTQFLTAIDEADQYLF